MQQVDWKRVQSCSGFGEKVMMLRHLTGISVYAAMLEVDNLLKRKKGGKVFKKEGH